MGLYFQGNNFHTNSIYRYMSDFPNFTEEFGFPLSRQYAFFHTVDNGQYPALSQLSTAL
jgi:hypothetical protein